MWGQPPPAVLSLSRDEGFAVACAEAAQASSAVQTHLMNGGYGFAVARSGRCGEALLPGDSEQTAGGESVWQIEKDFLAYTTRLVGSDGKLGQFLQPRSRRSVRKKSDMKFFEINPALLQEGVNIDRLP